MNLGRFELGQELVVPMLCTDGDMAAVVPDAPPAISVYDADGSKVLSALMACRDRFGATGLFLYRAPLGSAFSVGRWSIALTWKYSGVGRLRVFQFEIVPGGDQAGAVVSQYFLERPNANYLVQRTDGGTRTFGRNPRL
jgi:hypothetical protein